MVYTGKIPAHNKTFSSNREATHYWYRFGLDVIPILPGTKKPAVRRDPWLNELGDKKVNEYWLLNPDNDVAFIVNESILVLDTDSPEATAALYALEKKYGISPCLIIKTSRGEHHYVRLGEGVFARSDSHDGKKHPERIDVKANRSMVNLPPSGVRTILHCSAATVDDLTEVDQNFVDAIFVHNGRPPPRPAPERELVEVRGDETPPAKLEALLNHIDPDCGYTDWTQVLMATFHVTQGSEAGLDLADAWSAKGKTYPGRRALEKKWNTFSRDVANPVTIGTLIKRAKEGGADIDSIMGDQFEVCTTEVVYSGVKAEETLATAGTLFDQYVLEGGITGLKSEIAKALPIFSGLALLFQITLFFASPGTGKTLLVLSLLMDSIRSGLIDAKRAYYVNLDDNLPGLFDKLAIAEEYGFGMIAEGHKGFKASLLLDFLESMAADGSAKNTIVIVDTVKKIVDVMDKRQSSLAMSRIRRFGMQGGTFIGLAHTNKNLGSDGKPVYGGTSDLRDDADCAYIVQEIEGGAATNEKFVDFTNIKRRGNNPLNVGYAYTLDRDISYADLLLSVRELEPEHLSPIKLTVERASEDSVIEVIKVCLGEGVCSKMKLATEVGKRAGISRRDAGATIDRHTGDDPEKHQWGFTVGARGAHVYRLLVPPTADPPEPAAG